MIITRAMPTQQTAITGVSRRITAGQEIKAELCRGPGRPAGLSEGVRARATAAAWSRTCWAAGDIEAFEPAVLRHRSGIVHALSGIRALG